MPSSLEQREALIAKLRDFISWAGADVGYNMPFLCGKASRPEGLQEGVSVQEFEPWFKWLLLDSVLTLAVGLLSTQLPSSKKVFRAIGWL